MRAPLVVAAALAVAGPVAADAAAKGKTKRLARPSISVLSNRADLISAGDALVAVNVPRGVKPSRVRVRLERRGRRARDVTKAFAVRPDGRLEGLVTGLPVGRSVLRAVAGRRRGPAAVIVNHPNGGPVFSGPQLQPWKCQRTAVDKQCNQPVKYTYLYKSSSPASAGLQPYDPQEPAGDVAMTTTDRGVRVPFIVRLETGYQDRDQYKILTLYRPGETWDRWAPQKQWNRKVLITHGGSCGADREPGEAPLDDYSGTLPAPIPNYVHSYEAALARGFAVLSTALDNSGHNCNVALQAESLVMAKEHLVETYGDLRYTIGTGCSGGALAQLQIANAYPGIYQGLIVGCAYPDAISTGAQFADYHGLRRYFENPGGWGPGISWTPLQWAAVEGHVAHVNAIAADEAFFKNAINPTYACDGITAEERYHPATNPGGVRCSLLDAMINVFGPRPPAAWSALERKLGRGFAGQPLGNVGVQYGLGALRRGEISPAQFADLNARGGGLGIDMEPTAERTAGDEGAVADAYRSGAINQANNLDRVAIINHSGPDPGLAHDYSHAVWMRLRIEREHGHHRNHVMWFGHFPIIGDTQYVGQALAAMDRWLAAVEADDGDRTLARKIVARRPAGLEDRCSQIPGVELVALPGRGKICQLEAVQTRLGTPRTVAGGPHASDVNKCALKPLSRADYPVAFTDGQWAQVRAAFPTGVCDWSKPGIGQQDTIPWMTYQDRSGKVIYGGRPLGPAPRRSQSGWASAAFR